jgi:hypothetical protein
MSITPSPNTAHIEQRGAYLWYVVYGGTVVGRHRAQYKAQQQADTLNLPDVEQDQLLTAARTVVTLWRRLLTEGPGTPDDLELALDNALAELENVVEEADES